MADKIHEVGKINTVATVNTEKQCKCQTSSSNSELELQIISLTKAIEEPSQLVNVGVAKRETKTSVVFRTYFMLFIVSSECMK